MTTLYLIRYGETLFNRKQKIQGFCDSPLTQKGIEQAKELYNKTKDIPFTHVYTSTSERTIDTASYMLGERTIPITSLKGLKEVNHGELEGEDESFVREHPEIYEVGFEAYRGESTQNSRNRITSTIKELCDKHPNECIAIVSHGGILMNFLLASGTSTMDELRAMGGIPNCACLVVEYDGKFSLKK